MTARKNLGHSRNTDKLSPEMDGLSPTALTVFNPFIYCHTEIRINVSLMFSQYTFYTNFTLNFSCWYILCNQKPNQCMRQTFRFPWILPQDIIKLLHHWFCNTGISNLLTGPNRRCAHFWDYKNALVIIANGTYVLDTLYTFHHDITKQTILKKFRFRKSSEVLSATCTNYLFHGEAILSNIKKYIINGFTLWISQPHISSPPPFQIIILIMVDYCKLYNENIP